MLFSAVPGRSRRHAADAFLPVVPQPRAARRTVFAPTFDVNTAAFFYFRGVSAPSSTLRLRSWIPRAPANAEVGFPHVTRVQHDAYIAIIVT
ncbi:Hypothetical predicted protein [Cloeon dipterum]|uniref:Uncharacterized protein n=1 Tax=Cloeon dipterum TaxID=197152 RepID=A0A8S1E1T4_9INSE|nr:Hypothetical predicted protein [Cloeon dipterum]